MNKATLVFLNSSCDVVGQVAFLSRQTLGGNHCLRAQ